MVLRNIIEGYSDSDVDRDNKFNSRVNNRLADYYNLTNKLNVAQTNKTSKLAEKSQLSSYNQTNLPRIREDQYEKQSEINRYTANISDLDKQNSNLVFDNINNVTTLDKHSYKRPTLISEYDIQQNNTNEKSLPIIPLKKKEGVGTKKYFSLLMFQNQEIKEETYSQKNNLTTADRNYSIHDSKIPYYVVVNKLLLYTYIAIALYIIYRVMIGMIVDNIYGKLVISLLITLYPIYIFNLEIAIYDQYNLIKSMIRAEPYKPTEI
jgi:hypothetical protein